MVRRVVGSLLVLALAAAVAHAGAPGAVKIAIASARAVLRDTVEGAPESQLPGIVQTLQLPDGQQFLVVDVALEAEWGEKERSATIKSEQVTLTGADGKDLPWVGKMTPTGHFRSYSPSLYLRKPYRKEDVGKPDLFNVVFAVPKGTKEATLKIGEATQKLTAAPAGELPKPGDFATFKIVEAKFVDAAKGSQSLGSKKPKAERTVTAAAGKLLAVQVAITPKRSNAERGSYFYINTWDLGLAFGKGSYVPAAGQIHGSFGYATNVSMNNHPNPDGSWKTSVYTVYFAVPEDLTDFSVTYLAAPMAKGTVGK